MLASWVLLTCALSLLAAGTLYTDAVTLAGLHRELLSVAGGGPGDHRPDQDPAGSAGGRRRGGRAGAAAGPRVDRRRASSEVLQSSAYADAAGDPETRRPSSRGSPRTRASRITPRSSTGAGRRRGRPRSRPPISEGAAAALLGVPTGDACRSEPARRDRARRRRGSPAPGRPTRPTTSGWPTRWRSRAARSSGSFTTRGPLVVADGGPRVRRRSPSRSTREWRAIPRVDGLHARVARRGRGARDGHRRAGQRRAAGLEPGQVATKLPDDPRLGRSLGARRPGRDPAAARPVRRAGGVRGDPRRGPAAGAASRARPPCCGRAAAGSGTSWRWRSARRCWSPCPPRSRRRGLAVLLVQAVRLNPALEGVGLRRRCPAGARSRSRSSAASSPSSR